MLVIFSILVIIFLGIFVDIFLVWRKIKEAERQSLRSESGAVNEISNDKDIPSNKTTAASPDTSSNHLRILAGILFSLTLLCLLSLSGLSSMSPAPIENYPLEYAFGVVLLATIILFFLMWQKEHKVVATQNIQDAKESPQASKNVFFLFCRIICGILALVFFIVTAVIIIFAGLRYRMWMLAMLSGGYAVLFLWIAITGKRPRYEGKSYFREGL
jgi:hypothetical protein